MLFRLPMLMALVLLLSISSYAQLSVRLVARSVAAYDGSKFGYGYDSTIYTYTGIHSNEHIDWDVDEQQMKFDKSHNYVWDKANSNYVISTIKAKQYDGADNIASILIDKNDNGNMYNDEIWNYTYDATGLVITEVRKKYDAGIGSPVNKDSTYYTYDPAGRLLKLVTYHWQTSNNSWQPYSQLVQNFDGSGNKLYHVSRFWYNNVWTDFQVVNNNYNANNNLILSTEMIAPIIGDAVVNTYKRTYTYQNNILKERTVEKWDDRNNQWLNDEQTTYSHNSNGDITAVLDKEWSNTVSNWEYTYLQEYFYYTPQHVKYVISKTWNVGTFVNTSRLYYTYNNIDLVATVTDEKWNMTSNMWEHVSNNSLQRRYFYSSGWPVGLDASEKENLFSVYPIPASRVVHLTYKFLANTPVVFTIYDMSGRVVKQWKETNTGQETKKNIPISNMAKGSYMITAQVYQTVHRQQLLIL